MLFDIALTVVTLNASHLLFHFKYANAHNSHPDASALQRRNAHFDLMQCQSHSECLDVQECEDQTVLWGHQKPCNIRLALALVSIAPLLSLDSLMPLVSSDNSPSVRVLCHDSHHSHLYHRLFGDVARRHFETRSHVPLLRLPPCAARLFGSCTFGCERTHFQQSSQSESHTSLGTAQRQRIYTGWTLLVSVLMSESVLKKLKHAGRTGVGCTKCCRQGGS